MRAFFSHKATGLQRSAKMAILAKLERFQEKKIRFPGLEARHNKASGYFEVSAKR